MYLCARQLRPWRRRGSQAAVPDARALERADRLSGIRRLGAGQPVPRITCARARRSRLRPSATSRPPRASIRAGAPIWEARANRARPTGRAPAAMSQSGLAQSGASAPSRDPGRRLRRTRCRLGADRLAALRERFEVIVYELGWQLGGKGASGRAPHRGAGAGGRRIQEHGLHIWFGFYEHAFGMLRDAYEESGLAAGDDWWRAPFEKCDAVSLYEQRDDGTWVRHSIKLPRRRRFGSRTADRAAASRIGRMLARTTRLIATGLRTELGATIGGGAWPAADDHTSRVASTLDQIAAEFDGSRLRVLGRRRAASRRHAAGFSRLDDARAADVDRQRSNGCLASSRRRPRSAARAAGVTEPIERLWRGVLELVTAALTGIVRDDVLWRGFGPWTRRISENGSSATAPVMSAGAFAGSARAVRPDVRISRRRQASAEPGRREGPPVAADDDQLRGRVHVADARRDGRRGVRAAVPGAEQRGVSFHFFSEVTRLRLMPGRPVIDAIELTRHATVAAGADAYDPLERIGDWWCWPAEPDRAQLPIASRRPRRSTRGADFDDVVLAIPVGASGGHLRRAGAGRPRFKLMLDRAGDRADQGAAALADQDDRRVPGVSAGRDVSILRPPPMPSRLTPTAT